VTTKLHLLLFAALLSPANAFAQSNAAPAASTPASPPPPGRRWGAFADLLVGWGSNVFDAPADGFSPFRLGLGAALGASWGEFALGLETQLYTGTRFANLTVEGADPPLSGPGRVDRQRLALDARYDLRVAQFRFRPHALVGSELQHVAVADQTFLEPKFLLAPGLGAFYQSSNGTRGGVDARLSFVFADSVQTTAQVFLVLGFCLFSCE
jgi:hypothetical protein